MTVSDRKVITLSYVVQENDEEGVVLESMDANYPFKFLFGKGELLPAFEHHLQGLKEGESFSFTLTPEEAYGPHEAGNMVDVPMDVFKVGGILQEDLLEAGKYVNLTDDQGHSHNGKVVEWDQNHVKVDFNHAMAGKSLFFRGVVLNIREATTEELARNNYVEEDGVRRTH